MKKIEYLDHIPTNWSLEAEILKGREIFVKRNGLDQERRERDWNVWVRNDPGRISSKYRNMHLDN